MNFNWLNRQNNNKLIIFFNGWGMDDTVIKHLEPDDYDILTVCDYNELLRLPQVSKYKKIHVVAWSMGVMMASLYDCGQISATAVNGTLFPIHQEYGINPRVYKLMENNFDNSSRQKFIRNMFDVIPAEFTLPARSTENQKSELAALRKYKSYEGYKYTRVIVSSNDKIIPTQSQMNYWKQAEIVSGGHCIFFNYSKWKELL